MKQDCNTISTMHIQMSKEDLQFQITDYWDYSDQSTVPESYVQVLFGRTVDDQDVCVSLHGFEPYYYLLLPPGADDEILEESIKKIANKVRFLCDKDGLEDLTECYLGFQIVPATLFRGFRRKKSDQFAKLSFTSLRAMRMYEIMSRKPVRVAGGEVHYTTCEAMIDPYLRIIHSRNLVSGGWATLPAGSYKQDTKISRCDISVRAHWKKIRPSEDQNRLAPIRILGYDLECYSSDTGMPQCQRAPDSIIQIGMTLYHIGKMDCKEQWLLNLGPCDPISGANTICFESEVVLIMEFAKLVSQIRPDIMAGHNTFGFDDPYIRGRLKYYDGLEAEKRGISRKDLTDSLVWRFQLQMGKLKNKTFMREKGLLECPTEYRKQVLESSAMGTNKMVYYRVPGIVPIDTYRYLRREYATLDSYTLDSVSSKFISEKVVKCEYRRSKKKGWREAIIFTKNAGALEEGGYIHLLLDHSYYTSTLCKRKFQVTEVGVRDGLKTITITGPKEDIRTLAEAPEDSSILWTFAKDDMPYTMISEHYRNRDATGMSLVGKYCLKDCRLVNLLLAKLNTILSSLAMATVCHVPLYYIFHRGQGAKNLSLIVKSTSQKGFLIPRLPKPENTGKYQGARVIEATPGIYEDTIPVVDFKSLYPRSIRQANVSHDSHITEKNFTRKKGYLYHSVTMDKWKDGKAVRDSHGNPIQITEWYAQEIVTRETVEKEMAQIWAAIDRKYERLYPKKGHIMTAYDVASWSGCGKKEGDRLNREEVAQLDSVYRKKAQWEKENEESKDFNFTQDVWVRYGIIPSVLGALLNERELAKGKMAVEQDPFLKELENVRQLALKVTANSIYGLLGAATSKIYYPNLASSTTALGRHMLDEAVRITLENYPHAEIIYGDTDSIFINFNIRDKNGNRLPPLEDRREAIRRAMELETLINISIPSPQEIEYEKCFQPFIQFSKKQYMGILYEKDPTKGCKKAMGMMLCRRNYAPIAKSIYTNLVDYVLYGGDLQEGLNYAHQLCVDLLHGKYPMEYFCLRKGLRADYKKPYPAHKILADRMAERDPGNAPQANDRIPFAFRVLPQEQEKTAKSGDRIETPEYIVENGLKIDYMYYLEHQIRKPLTQILQLLVEDSKIKNFFRSLANLDRNLKYGTGNVSDWTGQPAALDLKLGRKKDLWNTQKLSILDWMSGGK